MGLEHFGTRSIYFFLSILSMYYTNLVVGGRNLYSGLKFDLGRMEVCNLRTLLARYLFAQCTLCLCLSVYLSLSLSLSHWTVLQSITSLPPSPLSLIHI